VRQHDYDGVPRFKSGKCPLPPSKLSVEACPQPKMQPFVSSQILFKDHFWTTNRRIATTLLLINTTTTSVPNPQGQVHLPVLVPARSHHHCCFHPSTSSFLLSFALLHLYEGGVFVACTDIQPFRFCVPVDVVLSALPSITQQHLVYQVCSDRYPAALSSLRLSKTSRLLRANP